MIQHVLRQELESIALRGLAPRRPASGGIVIHPGSSTCTKCWPIQRFIALARRFHRAGQPVRVVLGAMELKRWSSAEIEQFARVAEMHQPTSLVELWQRVASAALYLGNDSGPGHLAGIIGVPTFCLFGPTDPTLWKPLGPRVHVLRHEPLTALEEEKVYGWIKDKLREDHNG
jgi:heptosyltransferase-3